jgi:drug/metabolite transporter (DMT)-like permease
MPSLPVVLAVLALAILATALAHLIYFRLLARTGATNALLVTILAPVTAVILGILLLGERLSGTQIVGALAIAFGLIAMDGRAGRAIARMLRP